jgi:hypothetical protein
MAVLRKSETKLKGDDRLLWREMDTRILFLFDSAPKRGNFFSVSLLGKTYRRVMMTTIDPQGKETETDIFIHEEPTP